MRGTFVPDMNLRRVVSYCLFVSGWPAIVLAQVPSTPSVDNEAQDALPLPVDGDQDPVPFATPPEAKAPTAAADVMVFADQDIRRQGADQATPTSRELEWKTGLTFVSGRDVAPSGDAVRFTDIGLLHTQVSYAPYEKMRISAHGTALLKQPAQTNNAIFQSAGLGVQLQLAEHWAGTFGATHGNLLEKIGTYQRGGLGVLGRRRMNEMLQWEVAAGVQGVHVAPSEPATTSWQLDAVVTASAQLCFDRCERRYGAAWLGMDAGFPIADATNSPYETNNRLGLLAGAFAPVSKQWDMYTTLAWIDHGDAEVPLSQLPILDGGFDQLQWTVGLIWHRAWKR